MNAKQRQQASVESAARIAAGEDPKGLVHVMYYPNDCDWSEDEIQGLSTALPDGSDLSGYTSRYYTLGVLAA